MPRRDSTSSLNKASQQLLQDSTGPNFYGSIKPSRRRHRRLPTIADHDGNYTGPGSLDEDDFGDEDEAAYDASVESLQEEPTVSVKSELKSIVRSSLPLSLTFFFEYLLAVNSLFLLGHLGSKELASASLAVMTFNITGMAVFEGLSTCLDTFCSQAFGAEKFYRVGLYFQRCTVMEMTISIPIIVVWWYSKDILKYVVPELELLELTQLYLRYLCFGAPGLILFETGKRYLQSQRIFHASTYVLIICLPTNIALNYFLIKWLGFIGAPIAISLTYWLMSLLLMLYVLFVDGKQCWGGLSSRAFQRWRPMLALALPGLVMIESEYLSFEILTVMASYFGTASLAAQSIVSNIGSLTYQLPFAVGCAISTRLAIYIGSGSIRSSKVSVRISYGVAAVVGSATCLTILILRRQLASLFTNDDEVLELAVKSMPILAFNQLSDTFNIIAAGILRSQGRQQIGSYFNLFSYYVVALPLAYLLAFKCDLEISGLWIGLGAGILILGISETICVINSKWPKIIREAADREEEEEVMLIDDDSTAASIFSGASLSSAEY